MKYSKAEYVFPQEVLALIQEYVQGELVYIPKPKERHKKWGENTQSKRLTAERNAGIKSAYHSGAKIEELSERYYLSVESIKKIVYQKE